MNLLPARLLLLLLLFYNGLWAQTAAPPDLIVDFTNGTLVFQPAEGCMQNNCHAGLAQLKDAITHITVRQSGKKPISTYLPVKVGSATFYLTIYNYPVASAAGHDTILHIEGDSIIIHDVGADGLLTDSTREYCINKHTQQRLDWHSNYTRLVQAGICPIACFMDDLHARGYKGYVIMDLGNGHSSILYY